MSTFAFVNASKLNEGTFVSSFRLFQELKLKGYNVRWYQCEDVGPRNNYYGEEEVIEGITFPSKTIGMGLNRLLFFPKIVRQIRTDFLVFSDPTLLGLMRPTRSTIVILHDIRPLTVYSDRITTRLLYRYIVPKLRDARMIIVPTHHVKALLVTLGIHASLVEVLPWTVSYSANSSRHISESLHRIKTKRELRVLCVSSDRGYKNIEFFIRLAEIMAESHGGYRFNFILVSELKNKTMSILRSSESKNLRVVANVKDIETIYASSDVLMFPSLFEGFGLPLIEAMSHGMPILVNGLQPMKEIVGEAGGILPVNDLDAWKQYLVQLTKEEFYRSRALSASNRLKAFSPEVYSAEVERIFKLLT